MFIMEFFKGFSTTEEVKFEDELIRWTRKTIPNKTLQFESWQIKVGKLIDVNGDGRIYKVILPRLCMEYIRIHADMCILLKVTRTDGANNKIIYTIPDSWGGTSPWLAES